MCWDYIEWDVPAGLLVANGAGEVLTKTVLDREASQGAEIDFYLQLFDKQNKSDTRQLTVVVADEDDNPPSPGHRDALVYNYKGVTCARGRNSCLLAYLLLTNVNSSTTT